MFFTPRTFPKPYCPISQRRKLFSSKPCVAAFLIAETGDSHLKQAARARPKGSHDLLCAYLCRHPGNPCRRNKVFFCEDCCLNLKTSVLSGFLKFSHKNCPFLLRGFAQDNSIFVERLMLPTSEPTRLRNCTPGNTQTLTTIREYVENRRQDAVL